MYYVQIFRKIFWKSETKTRFWANVQNIPYKTCPLPVLLKMLLILQDLRNGVKMLFICASKIGIILVYG
ncbi:MAG: hypothetical protein A3D96_01665 [Chlamydiae bacterium RIFCSPHIGHO2_12_FULL_44_59]|nr:MAG: hypothetical protein A2796_05500 [Chlamydiae bacterium RIFCSPHIGHO2_01_FULL_44_39]OGN56747.1 MAG: hypothetical protein A3C42_04685 [Chlamydiae bacterium RIFCSPHIGHO2_02_FULL_45_9]OGN60876.1 MAG: hypothetical protein A3D96_01665 [Chlamydiae bacterium RIFCSPHIGHO2_12_FULL_44_59]OGN66462.1 MAG: hypothetical protein A2978_01285 [Chlamydiae bacterium RIFCSPLOWO2_01_FULL_44_52]OGN69925.1 MAG: hypothetical protein A3I67_01275 [Chlamydiae bacterium RIFCSPLOWO2_02_FULL_45_22]OGN70997.1 MAG: hyp